MFTVKIQPIIDASGEDFFKKVSNNNKQIMELFDSKEDVAHVAKYIDNTLIAENDYNLSVSSHIEAEVKRILIKL